MTDEQAKAFTSQERAAIRERARERKAASGEAEVLAKIAEMAPGDRVLAERVHAIVTTTAPGLAPRTWYGMPAYARDGKIVCHFKSAEKFKTRYATLGFGDAAELDEGDMWPTEFAILAMSADVEARIASLLARATASAPLPRIGKPATRALEQAGLHDLDAVAQRSEREVAAMHGMGPKALGLLKDALREHGLAFAS